jgi:hypothetical protein
MESKFKYLLMPENMYILDFGNFRSEATGKQILDLIEREFYLNHLFEEQEAKNKQGEGKAVGEQN